MAMELRTKLNSLWDRLQIDVTHREQFVSSIKGFGKSVINEVLIKSFYLLNINKYVFIFIFISLKWRLIDVRP